jgi:hypothetical protein
MLPVHMHGMQLMQTEFAAAAIDNAAAESC